MEKKKLVSIFCLFFLSLTTIYSKELKLDSDKYILYNLNDNKILLEEKAEEKTQIASLTKIMTVIVAIENIDDYNKKITITNDMIKDISWDVSVVGFNVGENVTINDLLHGALLSSGADAVNALALTVSKDFASFVKLMNDKAKKLNLTNTHFQNVIGLTNEENYSTASDVAKLLNYALKNKKFKEVFKTKKYTSTTNRKMISTIVRYNMQSNENISFILGAKTGYTNAAGYCLASIANINNIDYLLITLNAKSSSASHIKDAVNTYTYFSENYDYNPIVKKDTIITNLKTKYSKEKELAIVANVELKSYLKNDYDFESIKYEYEGVERISYFTRKGKKLGKVKIIYNEEVLDEFELVYSQRLSFSIISFLIQSKIWILILIFMILSVKRKFYHKKKRKLKRT